MIKILRTITILMLLPFMLLAFYGNHKFKAIDINQYAPNSVYSTIPKEDYEVAFDDFDSIFIKDENIQKLEDLILHSPIVLKIKTGNTIKTVGQGILNQCTVLEVIKSDTMQFQQNQTILIYDNIMHWEPTYIVYFEGSKPLALENEYIVFLKEAPNPNTKNTYIFSSTQFGSFPLTKECITEYNIEKELTIEEARNIHYISSKEEYIQRYQYLHKQIIERFL